jgi:hypothetical protein
LNGYLGRTLLKTTDAQILGARSPWWLNFIWWHLISEGP